MLNTKDTKMISTPEWLIQRIQKEGRRRKEEEM
jgi:hypothetical protein